MVDISFKPSREGKSYANRRWEEKVSKSLENHLSYSTTPKATGETWIDGSPIKRVVVDTGTLPNATSSNTAHGITFTNIIKIYGWATNGSTWITLPYPHQSTSHIRVTADATNVTINAGSTNWSSYTTSYVVLEYY